MRRLSISRVEGVLAPCASGFRSCLIEGGYRPPTVEDQVWLMAHLSRWLDEQGMEPGAFTDEAAERFQRARRERYSHLTGSRALRPLVGYLRGLGTVPEPRSSQSPAEAIVAAYREYLLRERGLVEGSVVLRARVARLFLGELSDPIEAALAQLRPGDVTRFVVAQCGDGRRGTAWASTLVSGLRSLLVFLHVTGRVAVPLAAAVPSVASWRLSSLPRGLDRDHLARILASCDRATAVGRRDYAILMLLQRLGLRACEVAALTLHEIDWRAAELTIHGKGGQTDRLPLPRDVGDALVACLRDPRRDGECRSVFVRAFAPHGALSEKAIGAVLRDACDRAGVPRVGTHRLRHTVATELLAAGAPYDRDRSGFATHEPVEHRDLREGRPHCAARSRASVAAGGSRDVSTLAQAADDYLRVRRALGYKLERQGRQLLQFVAHLDRAGATTVTIEHAIGWATLPAGATGGYWCDRLSVVRQFARYLQTIDPACEVPAKGLLPYRRARPIPFLFTAADIERVMRARREGCAASCMRRRRRR